MMAIDRAGPVLYTSKSLYKIWINIPEDIEGENTEAIDSASSTSETARLKRGGKPNYGVMAKYC